MTAENHQSGRIRGAGPSGGSGARNLTLRTLSAAVLAPIKADTTQDTMLDDLLVMNFLPIKTINVNKR